MSNDQLMVHWAAHVISLCPCLPTKDAASMLQSVDWLLGVWDGKIPGHYSAEVFINSSEPINIAHKARLQEIQWLTLNTCLHNLVNATAARVGGTEGDDSCTA